MRIRLVIDLLYPGATSAADEELIKHRLSTQVLATAREQQFNVLALDEQKTIKVEEIMVGCARVEDAAPAFGTDTKPEKVFPPDPGVYGDEDGDYWFASGHLSVGDMVKAVIAWESEVADPINVADIEVKSHSTYYVVEDPENSEKYKLVESDFPGAQPMTSIRRA